MNRLTHKQDRIQMRKNRVRKTVSSSADRPRLSVYISARHISAQVIDDTTSKTIAYATTVGAKQATGTMTEKATWVGEQIAKKAIKKSIKNVAFDRGSRLYHGRIKALAEAARKEGLEF